MYYFFFRQYWCDYFNKEGNIHVFFWSAKLEAEKMTAETDTTSDDEDEGEVGVYITSIYMYMLIKSTYYMYMIAQKITERLLNVTAG